MSNVTKFPGPEAGEPTTDKVQLYDIVLFDRAKPPMFFKDVQSMVIMPTPTDNILIMNWLDGKTVGASMKDVVSYEVVNAAERTTLQ